MAFKINISCTNSDRLGAYLHDGPGSSSPLPKATLPGGQNKNLDPGQYAVVVVASFATPGMAVSCEILGRDGSKRACNNVIGEDGRLYLPCDFTVDEQGRVA